MVSLSTNLPEGFYSDPTVMALPSFGSFSSPTAANTASSSDELNKKIRKPYSISKSRDSWSEPEHDKFIEALQLFDRDWKKIEAFVGSKTVIQIRSHAQKYFLKVQKGGTNEHLPPPRPKRKSAHPYPQKASKIVSDLGFTRRTDSSALLGGTDNSLHTTSFSLVGRDDVRSAGQSLPNIYSCCSNESTPTTQKTVLPDFAQVYSFLGNVFDPNVTDHLQKLKKMDPIDIETMLLLMRNLSINLASPDFENHRRLLSSGEFDLEEDNAYDVTDSVIDSLFEDAA